MPSSNFGTAMARRAPTSAQRIAPYHTPQAFTSSWGIPYDYSATELEFGEGDPAYVWRPTTAGHTIQGEEIGLGLDAFSGAWMQKFRSDMQNFREETESEIRRLSVAVEKLTGAVSSYQTMDTFSDHANDQANSKEGMSLDEFETDEERTTMFNRFAESDFGWSPAWRECVLVALTSPKGGLRSAAARALAAHDPDEAEIRIPSLLATEKNKFVVSIMSAALEACRL